MSEIVKTPNTHLPECADCTRQYEKWCSYFEARQTCDYKQYLQQRREPFIALQPLKTPSRSPSKPLKSSG